MSASDQAVIRFNEAAGIPRGRLESTENTDVPARRASMRPRVFPAEDNRRVAREEHEPLMLQ